MNRKRWLAVIGVVGATVLVTGCLEDRVKQLEKDVKELQDYETGLKEYLKPGGALNVWLSKLSDSVCDLEQHVTGLDQTKLHCTGSDPGDKTPPPAYPPAP